MLADHLEHTIAKALDRLGCANRTEVGGVGHEKSDDPAAVQVIDELDGADLELPAILSVPGPAAADPHHGAQRDVCGEIPQRTDTRAVSLLDGEDDEAAF